MENTSFEILSMALLEEYSEATSELFLNKYQQLEESDLTINNFSFYTSVSAVFSSKIEGENIDLDSYVKHKRFGIEYLPDYTQKIDDLYNAYQFAKTQKCTVVTISKIQEIISKNILPPSQQGKLRTGNMFVTTTDGKIEYVAASPISLKMELDKFFQDLAILLNMELSVQEVFYFASLIHLVFVKIHPFNDGNGRSSRLIEKWFLAEKLGEKAWLIQSERYYYLNHQTYYKNIRMLGLEYELLDYSKALPFLLMLPQSLILND